MLRFSTVCLVVCCLAQVGAVPLAEEKSDDLEAMKEFLAKYSKEASKVYNVESNIDWNYATNMTDENSKKAMEAGKVARAFWRKTIAGTKRFNWQKCADEQVKRQFSFISSEGLTKLSNKKLDELSSVGHNMNMVYSTAFITRKDKDGKEEKLLLDPGLTELMATNRDYDTLKWAFKGWRDVSGKKMKKDFARQVDILNEAARLNGYKDEGDYWRSWYEVDDFEEQVDKLYDTIKPFYLNLHAYVRNKLQAKYSKHKFPESGHIPAHLFGNMWAQTWNNIFDIVKPFQQAKVNMDVTDEMVAQKYTVKKMFKMAEEFFTSIGLPKMVPTFWTKSLMKRPKDGRSVVCHPSAWDFFTGNDFRIKMCTTITMQDLITIHHEMGHNQYQHLYSDQPMPFRDGANNAFHEAIGDTIALSASTPAHLQKVGLIETVVDDEHETINYLMSIALKKIAFLPFGFMMDKFRWGVFDGTTKPDNYTRHWWDLRCKYQGISPPITRGPDDFDPGAKYHIAANVAYIRYFISYIIQFQFHEALCKEAGHEGSLHTCDIYRSKKAGAKLTKMLKMGASKPWPEAMQAITGQSLMKADAIVSYFEPLNEFLKKENAGKVGWKDACPSDYFLTDKKKDKDPNSSTHLSSCLSTILALLVTVRIIVAGL